MPFCSLSWVPIKEREGKRRNRATRAFLLEFLKVTGLCWTSRSIFNNIKIVVPKRPCREHAIFLLEEKKNKENKIMNFF